MSDEEVLRHGPGDAHYRRILVALFAAGFATFAQLSDVQAVLPAMASDLAITPATAALTVSATTLGLAASVLPWSAVSDRFGRVAAMKVSILVSGVLGIVGPMVTDFSWFLVVRVLLGAALGALPAISMAYLAEEIRRPHVTATASIFLAGNTIGGLAGRLLAGPLAEFAGWRAAIEAVSVLALLAGITFLLVIPKPVGFRSTRGAGDAPAGPSFGARIMTNLRDPGMRALYLQGALIMGTFAAIYNYAGFHLQGAPFFIPPEGTSLVFLVFLFGTVAAPIAGRFAERLGRVRVIVVSLLVLTAGLLLTIIPSAVAVVAGLALFTMGAFVAHTLASSWVGQRAIVGRAQATATYQLSFQLGASVIGWVGGIVLELAGWSALALCLVALALAAVVTAIVVLAPRDTTHPNKKEKHV